MDDNGPVEVLGGRQKFDPPTITKPESSKRGNQICREPKVFFRYANGMSGAGQGARFRRHLLRRKGASTIDRGRCQSDPPELALAVSKACRPGTPTYGTGWTASRAVQVPNADVEIGHRSATVCHLGNIARWTNRKLRWDPVKEIFPDDADANQYLDRPRRKPYELPQTV